MPGSPIAVKPLGAVITGAERLKPGHRIRTTPGYVVWQIVCSVLITTYTTAVYGDWYFVKADKHTGCVYLNGRAMYEAVTLDECLRGEVYPCSWVPEDSVYK